MDALIELIAILALYWRLGLLTLGALALAVFLGATLSWFVGWHGIVIVLLGLGAGFFWEFNRRT